MIASKLFNIKTLLTNISYFAATTTNRGEIPRRFQNRQKKRPKLLTP